MALFCLIKMKYNYKKKCLGEKHVYISHSKLLKKSITKPRYHIDTKMSNDSQAYPWHMIDTAHQTTAAGVWL